MSNKLPRKNRKTQNILLVRVMVLVVTIGELSQEIHENVLGFKLEDTEEPGDRHDTLEEVQGEEEDLGAVCGT